MSWIFDPMSLIELRVRRQFCENKKGVLYVFIFRFYNYIAWL